MTTENLIGSAAVIMGLIVACIGLPIQIFKNFKQKSTGGLSLSLWTLGLLNGLLWLSYGLIKYQIDWYIVIANIPGVFFTLIILLQFYYYRKSLNFSGNTLFLRSKTKILFRISFSRFYIKYHGLISKLSKNRFLDNNITNIKFEKSKKMSLKKQYLKKRPLCKTTFTIPKEIGKTANSVHIVGDFTNWQEAAIPMKKLKNGNFTTSLNLEVGKEYQFRYLINETTWENDWNADKYTPSPYPDAENSVVVA